MYCNSEEEEKYNEEIRKKGPKGRGDNETKMNLIGAKRGLFKSRKDIRK